MAQGTKQIDFCFFIKIKWKLLIAFSILVGWDAPETCFVTVLQQKAKHCKEATVYPLL